MEVEKLFEEINKKHDIHYIERLPGLWEV